MKQRFNGFEKFAHIFFMWTTTKWQIVTGKLLTFTCAFYMSPFSLSPIAITSIECVDGVSIAVLPPLLPILAVTFS